MGRGGEGSGPGAPRGAAAAARGRRLRESPGSVGPRRGRSRVGAGPPSAACRPRTPPARRGLGAINNRGASMPSLTARARLGPVPAARSRGRAFVPRGGRLRGSRTGPACPWLTLRSETEGTRGAARPAGSWRRRASGAFRTRSPAPGRPLVPQRSVGRGLRAGNGGLSFRAH